MPAKKIVRSDHHLQSVTAVMSFSSKIREVPWANNRLFWNSIKSTFQRIKNREFWRSVWRVMVKSYNAAHSEMSRDRAQCRSKTTITSSSGVRLRSMTTRWKGNFLGVEFWYMFCAGWSRNSTKKRQQQTMEKVMTMSQNVWRTLCTKVDDLKLANAGGNKIRGTMMPPIFSMGCSRSF